LVSTKLDRDPDGRDVHAEGNAGNASSSDGLIDSVRGLVDRYCQARLSGLPGGAEAAVEVSREICLAAADAVQQRQDRGAPVAALVFSIAAHHVAEAQRELERRSSGPAKE
jgi:RNA polymerase sigma-70 factor, ECF subfamily